MSTHEDTRKKRLVLYLPPSALAKLEEEAGRRSERAGVVVTPEATARAILMAALSSPEETARALLLGPLSSQEDRGGSTQGAEWGDRW